MPLPWVRLDSNIGSHDKVTDLLADPSPKRWQAYASYMTALGWCGGQETDGRIPTSALPFVHGTSTTARLLVKYRLWEEGTGCWWIVNYAERQQLAAVTQAKKIAQSLGARKANCRRFHEAGCTKCGGPWDD